MPDWLSTLLIQIANVAILVFLLRRFLYKPVRKILAERRARVEKDMDDAASVKEQAEALKRTYEERLKNVEAEAETIEAESRERARREVEGAGEKAKEAAAGERAKARLEEAAAVRALRTREIDVALSLSRRLLESASGPALASHLALELAARVRGLEAEEVPPLPGETGKEAVAVLLKTSHDPDPEAMDEVRRAFRDRLGREISLETRIDGSLLCGAEVECGTLVVRSHLARSLEEARAALETSMAGEGDGSEEGAP
jgi:F-type H+-transporting ATPase subunit b